ncbi:hypothetical protein FH972_026549 [Carpinus fangiana]|uniref:DUF6594 domain-containing protein n=1 Tax=Carpinus fangiana TaxID=176857 RepID=A0A5N6L4L8_9ROSI|nr:hypothetical protein FH972_026549 [Carpinus fangiana]
MAGANNAIVSPESGDYHGLSNFMGRWPALCIFRRFSTLNVQNILFLQAELAHLEEELLDIRESRSTLPDTEKDDVTKDWQALQSQPDEYRIVEEIRTRLCEYNEALVQYHSVCSLQSPTKIDLEALRHYLYHPSGGDGFLRAVEADAYDRTKEHTRNDLLTVSDERSHRDIFSTFVADHCTAFYQTYVAGTLSRKNPDVEEGGLAVFHDARLHAISHIIGTLIASLLPAACIFALYFIDHVLARLGAIMGFSALFSFTLAIFTRARPVEIFAATAAFASVQVVFVGTTLGRA